jgi:hypothetical protein
VSGEASCFVPTTSVGVSVSGPAASAALVPLASTTVHGASHPTETRFAPSTSSTRTTGELSVPSVVPV